MTPLEGIVLRAHHEMLREGIGRQQAMSFRYLGQGKCSAKWLGIPIDTQRRSYLGPLPASIICLISMFSPPG